MRSVGWRWEQSFPLPVGSSGRERVEGGRAMVEMDAPFGELSVEVQEKIEEARARNYHVPQPAQRKPTRIVCIGGGTGLPTVLKGLARKALPTGTDPGLDVTAVVAMSDDGGSSGKLRRTRGMLP